MRSLAVSLLLLPLLVAAECKPPTIKYIELGKEWVTPRVQRAWDLGAISNEPTLKYIVDQPKKSHSNLPGNLLVPGVNINLTTDYPISNDTGVLDAGAPGVKLGDLNGVPHLSRNGGKGGWLDCQNLFIFADTAVYTSPRKNQHGQLLGLTFSSVAIGIGHRKFSGISSIIEDGVGQWADNEGRMRGFIPLTTGEFEFNREMHGSAGQRIAVWPSPFITLNKTHAIMYAPIVHVNVDRAKGDEIAFTFLGTSLLIITTQEQGGPKATRVVSKLFNNQSVEWGTLGGIRSWSSDGVGGTAGWLYVFGRCPEGLKLMRTLTDVSSMSRLAGYQYLGDSGAWLGNITAGTPLKTILPKDGGYGAVDMFYAPAHGTFIFTYTNNASDSTIYYQYLKPDHALLPYYIPSKGDLDLVENILKYNWSEPQVLYKANDIPEGESVQLAGPHLGYYEKDDITNGGTRMLITWTVSTGQDGGSRASGYELRSASIQWNSGADGVFVMNAVTYYGLVVCVGLFLW